METYDLKLVFVLLACFTLINSCSNDSVEPASQEVRKVVNAEDIPNVTKALLDRMGLVGSDRKFYLNNEGSNQIFDIDWKYIM